MLKSLLLLVLFVGLISMVLPEDRKGQYVRFLLIVVIILKHDKGNDITHISKSL